MSYSTCVGMLGTTAPFSIRSCLLSSTVQYTSVLFGCIGLYII